MFCVWSLFCSAVLSCLSGFTIISLRKRAGYFTLFVFLLSCGCFFLSYPWVDVWSVIVAFTGHTLSIESAPSDKMKMLFKLEYDRIKQWFC